MIILPQKCLGPPPPQANILAPPLHVHTQKHIMQRKKLMVFLYNAAVTPSFKAVPYHKINIIIMWFREMGWDVAISESWQLQISRGNYGVTATKTPNCHKDPLTTTRYPRPTPFRGKHALNKTEWICSLFKEWIWEKSEIRVHLEWIWSEHLCYSLILEWPQGSLRDSEWSLRSLQNEWITQMFTPNSL